MERPPNKKPQNQTGTIENPSEDEELKKLLNIKLNGIKAWFTVLGRSVAYY